MRRLAFALLLLPFVSGCITLFSKTEVVRSQEDRRPVTFDTPEANQIFHEAVAERSGYVGGAYVGGPFVTLYHRAKLLSENAKFNDGVTRADTNRDGVITEFEARTFATRRE